MRRFLVPAMMVILAQANLAAAAPLQVSLSGTDARAALLASADSYLGVPYRYGGTNRRGMDCSGLVITSFKDALGAVVPRTAASLYSWTEKIADKDMQPGDLVFFKTAGSGISHVGIYSGDGRFIHAASEGPATGVIYSRLDEDYWRTHYAGAGRALPAGFYSIAEIAAGEAAQPAAVPASADVTPAAAVPATAAAAGQPKRWGTGEMWKSDTGSSPGRMILGIAAAPSWNGFLKGGYPLRGAAAQLRFAFETHALPKPMLFGVELRPEWDGALGVFRMPITLSAGFDDRFRIFVGPSLGTGGATLNTEGGPRRYRGGMNWIGAAGISAAPFSMNVGSRGALAPYAEFAWQNYVSENGLDWNADACAGLRFSTGIRYTFTVKK